MKEVEPVDGLAGGSKGGVTVLDVDRVTALAANLDVYRMADALPAQREGSPGRPAEFPDYVWVLFAGLLGIFGSARKAAAAMASPLYWSLMRKGVAACLGPAAALALPAHGPSRNQWNWHSRRLRDHLPQLQ
ncbi:hypothetical protein LVX13_19005 [Streptomyces albulus]|uniref:hypothetical protein n=1 Tax=Streptomyces noursei TaxID=1971 RepID=UPI001F490C6F|nr:hypothetical protein [Streptomyces noursei]MCE4945187.1 hypothetical protein [Streptomyces noursei]